MSWVDIRFVSSPEQGVHDSVRSPCGIVYVFKCLYRTTPANLFNQTD